MKYVFYFLSPVLAGVLVAGCRSGARTFDAQGTFEADEVIVSAEVPGKLIHFQITEGAVLRAGDTVGKVDPLPLQLQQEQARASIQSLPQKTATAAPQVQYIQQQLKVQEAQEEQLVHEKARIQRLLKEDAATGKQLDDLEFQLMALRRQMNATRQQIAVQENAVATQNRAILSETPVLQKRLDQLNDQIQRTAIINPVSGTVLTRYAMEGEMAGAGKALYKVANLNQIYLRAYLSGGQLQALKLGQPVKVFTDKGSNQFQEYTGKLVWISDKAEFTPKTIQTKEERVNLVYAVKIQVPNDGLLKIGMYGEINL